jgi:hypothetical protein
MSGGNSILNATTGDAHVEAVKAMEDKAVADGDHWPRKSSATFFILLMGHVLCGSLFADKQ